MAETKKTSAKSSTKTATKKVATKKASAKSTVAVEKAEKKSANKIKVIYTKSCIGYNKNQAKVLESLGLKKLNDSNVLPDNPAVRGMIFKVRHLVSVENA